MNTIRSRKLGRLLTGALCLAALACGREKPAPTRSAPIAQVQQALGEVGNPACVPNGTHYQAGTRLFVDRTSEWGLTGVTGSRLTVADVNGDNYPDLVVREASDRETDFDARRRPVWVMKNTRSGRFQDVTRGSGLLLGRAPVGTSATKNSRASQVVVFADVDNDGDLDAFSGTRPYADNRQITQRSEILYNDGAGGFELRPEFLPATMRPGGATFLDREPEDGFIDLLVPSAQQRLVGNAIVNAWFLPGTREAPRFTADQAEALGITFRAGDLVQSSVACDLNADGMRDLLLGTLDRQPNGLYAGSASGFTGTAGEYVSDAVQDWRDNLYARAYCALARDGQTTVRRLTDPLECGLAHAQGVAACASCPCNVTPADDVAGCTGVADYPAGASIERRADDASRWFHTRSRGGGRLGGSTFTTLCADFDGDGKLDLFNAEVRSAADGASADASEVLINTSADEGPVTFSRPGQADTNLVFPHVGERWTEAVQTAAAFDMDNDGRTDLYVGGSDADVASNVGHLFHNTSTGSLHFDEVPSTDAFRHLRSQGVAVGDFDRDGDLDLVLGYSRLGCYDVPFSDEPFENCERTEQVRFFENQYGSGGNWVAIKLVGSTGTNRAAIGARVTLELDNGLKLVQEVDGGHGHFGAQEDHVLHFGLGADCGAEVTVQWPDRAKTTESYVLQTRRHYRLVQGSGQSQELPLRGYCSANVARLAGAVGVGQANDYYDVFCVQDRLAALGYHGAPRPLAAEPPTGREAYKRVPQLLSVSGLFTAETEWAIKTFQTTIQGESVQTGQSGRVALSGTGFTTYQWLQASNAPEWRELPASGTGWYNADDQSTDNHDWGASWAFDVLDQAGATFSTSACDAGTRPESACMKVNDLSFPAGGPTNTHEGHEGGLNIDVRKAGAWYDFTFVSARLASGGGFWSPVVSPPQQPPPNYCPMPAVANGGRFGTRYADATDEARRWRHLDATILALWDARASTVGCGGAIRALAPAGSADAFRAGFDSLIPLRAGYDRVATQAQIAAFLEQQPAVRRVVFHDPVIFQNLTTTYGNRIARHLVDHAHHFHVDVNAPAREP